MHWSPPSIPVCTLLVDLLLPNALNVLVSTLFGFVVVLTIANALPVDLPVLVLLNMFVKGLFIILFRRSSFLVDTHRLTFVLAGLSAVKCLQIGLLLVCSISLTLFILWYMTGLHLRSHFFSCWFVASNLCSSGSSNVFNSSSGRTISRIVHSCVTLFDNASYSETILPPNTGVFLSMHLSVHISLINGPMDWKNVAYIFFHEWFGRRHDSEASLYSNAW